MIYIDYQNEISSCLYCKSYEKLKCECISLDIYVYEDLSFFLKSNHWQSIKLNKNMFEIYQEMKKNLIFNVSEKYPKAENFVFYPFNIKELLKNE